MSEKPGNWNAMTVEEKRKFRLDAWVRGDGIEFESAEAKESYQKRAKRFSDALELKTPDRVPIAGLGGAFVYRRAGIPQKATMYDRWEEAAEAIIKYQLDFQPDSVAMSFMMSGASMEFLEGRALPGVEALMDRDTTAAAGRRRPARGQWRLRTGPAGRAGRQFKRGLGGLPTGGRAGSGLV